MRDCADAQACLSLHWLPMWYQNLMSWLKWFLVKILNFLKWLSSYCCLCVILITTFLWVTTADSSEVTCSCLITWLPFSTNATLYCDKGDMEIKVTVSCFIPASNINQPPIHFLVNMRKIWKLTDYRLHYQNLFCPAALWQDIDHPWSGRKQFFFCCIIGTLFQIIHTFIRKWVGG